MGAEWGCIRTPFDVVSRLSWTRRGCLHAEPGHILMIYTAEPGSPSADRLRILASLTADPVQVGPRARGQD